MADRRPRKISRALATTVAAEQRLSDIVLAEIGAAMGDFRRPF